MTKLGMYMRIDQGMGLPKKMVPRMVRKGGLIGAHCSVNAGTVASYE